MKVKYSPKVDILTFDFAEGEYEKSQKVGESIVVDLDKTGKVLGLEILDASENIQQFDPASLIVNLQFEGSGNQPARFAH